jgi:molybdopterin-binding protein
MKLSARNHLAGKIGDEVTAVIKASEVMIGK